MLRNESKIYYRGSCHSTIHTACSRDISGGYSDGVPPLPIPNREVKPDRADGTAHPRESRSPPFYESPEFIVNSGLFCLCATIGWSKLHAFQPRYYAVNWFFADVLCLYTPMLG